MVTLEWSEPLDRGGRGDLSYRVLCSACVPNATVPEPDPDPDPDPNQT